MKTRQGRLATYVLVFLAVLAAGCQQRSNLSISFKPDSSGQITLSVLMDDDAIAAAGGQAALSDVIGQGFAEGWLTKPYEDAGLRGFSATTTFKDQAEFVSLVNDGMVGQEAPFSELSYTVVDDAATFSAALPVDVSYADLVDFVFTMVVDMPGDIQTSSAGTVEGSRVTWVLSSNQRLSPTERLTVTSGIDESAVPAVGSWLVVLAIGVLSILGLVSYAMWKTDAQADRSLDGESTVLRNDAVNAFVNPHGAATSGSLTATFSRKSTGGFCGSCGTPLHAADRFCPTCGASTEPATGRDTERA